MRICTGTFLTLLTKNIICSLFGPGMHKYWETKDIIIFARKANHKKITPLIMFPGTIIQLLNAKIL